MSFPPIINLIRCLLDSKFSVFVISENTESLPKYIRQNSRFKSEEVHTIQSNRLFLKLIRFPLRKFRYRRYAEKYCSADDIIWTTTDRTCVYLGKILLRHIHIMQLMELEYKVPYFLGLSFVKFPISKFANKAFKVVVPEENRAHIESIWWSLNKIPEVLPNKPYDLLYNSDDTDELRNAVDEISAEKRKVILYLGVFGFDRDLRPYAEAVKKLGSEYVLYLVGKVHNFGNTYAENKKEFDKLLADYPNIKYLGYYNAPNHLAFVKYAHIGLLPYCVNRKHSYAHQLNALYCAPNKIYEYAGFGIPMLGTNVLGLKLPFDKYQIGKCCEDNRSDAIVEAISYIENNYDEMSANCIKFYEDTDYKSIVQKILEVR